MRPTAASLALPMLLLASPAPALAQGGVSVGGFETDGSVGLSRADYQAVARALGSLLGARLGSDAGARVVPIKAPPADRPGRVDIPAAREAASAAGASYLVVGSLLDQYGDIQLQARIVDAATGKPIAVVRGDPAYNQRDQLAQAIAALADSVAAQPNVGGKPGQPAPSGIPVAALIAYGRGLALEDSGDKAGAAREYRAAVAAAAVFSQASAALKRVGG